MYNELLALFNAQVFSKAFVYFLKGWPIWAPVIILNVAFGHWLDYVRRNYISKQGSVLLEVRLPRDVPKSPAAMEVVLNGIFEPGTGGMVDVFWEGKVRDWFSLEIVSIEGEIKFYVWAFPKWKKIIESRIYAQYPGAEVVEAEDYAKPVVYDPEKVTVWGAGTKLNKADAYPIKTYIDYQLDKTKLDDQEESIDPMTPLLEYMGTLKKGEQAWVQILIQAHRKEGLLDARVRPKADWNDGIKTEVKKILEKESLIKVEKDKPASFNNLTDIQKDTIKAIERNASKTAFDAMVRLVYVADKDVFDKAKGGGLLGSFRQFGSQNLNGFRPDWTTGVGAPWQDWRDLKKHENQRGIIDAYKRRSFFNTPYRHAHGKPYILTTEELATLFHLPGAAAATPTLMRSPSKKAEAPANLPI
jgi:hypothetical protein